MTFVAAILLGLATLIAVTAGLREPFGGPQRFTARPLADAAVFASAAAAIAIPVPLLLGGLALATVAGTLLDRLTTTPLRTLPPGERIVLYDGNCVFCRGQLKNLVRLARPGAIEPTDFQQPGALDRFPGVTHAACMQAMQLVTPDGRVYSAFEAAVRAVATRRPIGLIAYFYYVPGLRILFDAAYAIIAAQRYRIAGRQFAAGACAEGDACAVHFHR
jgi:predicted DCC family thiol-disulfide oxidoreductase YuxK